MSVNKSKLSRSIQNRGQYFIGPNEIWSLPISSKAKLTYIYLISQSDSWNPGIRVISDAIGIGREGVADALSELEQKKMIEIVDNGTGMRKTYMVNGIEEWILEEEADVFEGGHLAERRQPPSGKASATQRKLGHIQEESKKISTTAEKKISKEEILPEKVKLSPEQIYRSWLSQLPESRYECCLDELMVLFATLIEHGLTESDISSSLKKKILVRWSKSKYPQRIEEWWEQALGSTFGAGLALATPDMPKTIQMNPKKSERMNGDMDVDVALKWTTEDDEIERMMKEFETLRNGEET